jgi:uncharacterized cupin superfamily protein
MTAKMAMPFLGILLLAGTAYAQETRTEFKKADLTGTKMEIWTAVYDFPPGTEIPRHSHNGEEIVYVIAGATVKRPDGRKWSSKPDPTILSSATSCTAASSSSARAR